MSDVDAAPAAEIESAEPKSISEIIAGRSDEHHDGHKEVGAPEPELAPVAAPEPAPAPAPVAEIKIDPAAKPEAEQPFWYRQEAKKLRQRAENAERELEASRNRPPPQPRQEPQGEPDDPNRPLTRAELEFYRNQDALIGRLERSEERFTDKLGEETFEATKEWLATRPDIEEWALKQRDPWKAAHSQFTKEKLAAEIGEDPNAWRDAERERIRQEILAEQAGQGQQPPAPRAPATMRAAPPAPASLARSATPRDDAGRFAGPQPIGALSKHKFG